MLLTRQIEGVMIGAAGPESSDASPGVYCQPNAKKHLTFALIFNILRQSLDVVTGIGSDL